MDSVARNAANISIHALREEGDEERPVPMPHLIYFYPRPPRGGRLLLCGSCWGVLSISIHALREEGDVVELPPTTLVMHFYPRPPRGGRPAGQTQEERRR